MHISGSQSSLASTPGQSITTTSPKQSDEWPDPPATEPPVCSTEDEAASLYSDSGELGKQTRPLGVASCNSITLPDDILPYPPPSANIVNNGTYVIRKGRKQRQRIPDALQDSMSSINSKLSNAEATGAAPAAATIAPNPFPSSIYVPNSRHSIDLGATHSQAAVNQLLSSRTIHVPYPNNSVAGVKPSLNTNRTSAMNSPR